MNIPLKVCLIGLLCLCNGLIGCMLDIEEPTSSVRIDPADSTMGTGNASDGGDTSRLGDASNDGGVEPDIAVDQDMDLMTNSDTDVPLRDMGIIVDAMQAPEVPFFDTAWSHRVKILITPPAITEAVQHVPVYVRIRLTELADAESLQGDGDDIRFVDATGTIIPHTFVGCGVNNDNEIATVVKVPLIVPEDASQFVWMYYGNNNATASDLAMWADSDLAMFHMCELILEQFFVDRTGSNNSGVVDVPTQLQDSTWGRAARLQNGGGGLRAPTLNGREFGSAEFTVSFSTRLLGANEVGLLFGSSLESEIQYRLVYTGDEQCRFEGVGTK